MTELKFDKWQALYAKRTLLMKSSEIRDLLSVTARPDIISFAGGQPSTKSLKIHKVIQATQRAMHREGEAALQYGPSEGHEGLKECIAELMKEEGIEAETHDILVTGGAQQGLDLIGKVFIDPGDKIVMEAPSYVGALQAFSAYQPEIISVPLDDNGLKVSHLEKILEQRKEKPKFIYTVPNFQNPAGVTMSLQRRQKLIALAKKHQLMVVEDNPYGLLRFEGEKIRALRTMDASVIYLGTFSKIFSPGLRLGWVVAPKPILEKLVFAKQAADLCSSSFTQRVVEEYFNSNQWRKHVENLNKIYGERRDAMLKALEEFFPKEAKWTHPQGGFFIWVTLPKYLNTTELLAESIREEKVAYVPGRAFFADGTGQNSMRLAFGYPDTETIFEGIKRLSKVVKRQMSLYESLTKKLHL